MEFDIWQTENSKALGGCVVTYYPYYICTGLGVPLQPSEENHFTLCQLVEQLFQFMKKVKMIEVVCCSTVKGSPYL
jgi:hypothetical protein